MADELIDAPADVPQATGNTLPGVAAGLGDITPIPPPPPAAEVLKVANYGDQGAQDYNRLQALNQQAPVSTATMPVPAAPAAPPPDTGFLNTLAGGNPNQFSPIFGLLAGPQGQQAFAARAGELRAQAQLEQQRKQSLAMSDITFLKNLKDVPLNLRAGVIQSYATKMGRPELSPAEAGYIASIDQTLIDHTWQLASQGDPKAINTLNDLISGDPLKMVTAKSEMRLRNAQADAELAKATKDLQGGGVELKNLPKSTKELAAFEAAQKGLKGTAYSDYVNRRTVELDSSPERLEAARKKVTMESGARVAESPLPPAAADKLAGFDSALDIIGQLEKLYEKGSPTDQARQSWFNRVRQEVDYRLGFAMPDNLDEDTALRSLGAITAGRAFINGRPSIEYMKEIWKHTGQNPLVSPDQMRNRLKIMKHTVGDQKTRTAKYLAAGRGDLENLTNESTGRKPPVHITSPAEIAKLGPDVDFIAPDGIVRTTPKATP